MTTTYATTYTNTHTAVFLTGKLLLSLKSIILQSGLNPAKLTDEWKSLETAVKTWLLSGHLEEISIEVYRPGDAALIGRWDLTVEYGTDADGFWIDPDDINYQVRKAGQWPSACDYKFIISNKAGRPDVAGWGPCTFRSTDGLVRQSIGTIIDANGMRASGAYWRPQ